MVSLQIITMVLPHVLGGVWQGFMEVILHENHSSQAKQLNLTDSGGEQSRQESLLHLHWELKKNLLHPAPCYIMVGSRRDSILISSQPCSLLGIHSNHSIGEEGAELKNQGVALSQTGP
jgi:hypothetical protein